MMPVWLFVLARFYVDASRVVLPFLEIFKTLLAFVIPCLLGIVVRKRRPQVAESFVKVSCYGRL
jgi:predicted Na+-dependent transporter